MSGTGDLMRAFSECDAGLCLECGKCTPHCPVSQVYPEFSPRRVVKTFITDGVDGVVSDGNLWRCILCGMCSDICISAVKFPEFVRALRAEAKRRGNAGVVTHNGITQVLTRLMAKPNLRQNRLAWVTDDMKVKKEGDVLLFTGCQTYYADAFSKEDPNAPSTAAAAVRIMNALGVEPVVMQDERCCGHDPLWSGDLETFDGLREINTGLIRQTGAKVVVTPCAEGYYTLKNDYELDAEVLHISQYLAGKMDDGGLPLRENGLKVTFHDPCRLGRLGGEYDAPRRVLEEVPLLELVEMKKSGSRATCCGVTCWTNCTDFSRDLRLAKLQMAKATGADVLVTACAKCKIHLNCYVNNRQVEPGMDVDIKDFTVLVAESMGVL